MKILTVASLREVSLSRPAGYVEHILSSGNVINGDDGSPLYVALTDAAFDGLVKHYAPANETSPSHPTSGPGTELKKLLKLIGITATPNCSCNARARTMDANGCDWCEANLETIVGWLREEATKRRLPFLDAAGRMLVKRAINNARKAAS
jgi:hypothetical protein